MPKPCALLSIGNDDPNGQCPLHLARRCATWLSDVKQLGKSTPRTVVGRPILKPDENVEAICRGITEAVERVWDNGATWLVIYYAGHSVVNPLGECPDDILIHPVSAPVGDGETGPQANSELDRSYLNLHKQTMQTVKEHKLEGLRTVIFLDSCQTSDLDAKDQSDMLEAPMLSNGFDGNWFRCLVPCRYLRGVRDGCLFARAIERCAQEDFPDMERFVEHVAELTFQLSFGRLCRFRDCADQEMVFNMVLTAKQKREGLFQQRCNFLCSALDLWTDWELESDTADFTHTLQMLQQIATEFDRKQPLFAENECWELKLLWDTRARHSGLKNFLTCLQGLEDPVEESSERRFLRKGDNIDEDVRRAIVEVLEEEDLGHLKDDGLQKLVQLVESMEQWYTEFEGREAPSQPASHPSKTSKYKFLLIEDVKVNALPADAQKELATTIKLLCDDFEIDGRTYLVPGSLWVVFCLKEELSLQYQEGIQAKLKTWLDEKKRVGAAGWRVVGYPCWKPLYVVPGSILKLVQQVEALRGDLHHPGPLWLRASDVRTLLARKLNADRSLEQKVDEWRILVFEGLVHEK